MPLIHTLITKAKKLPRLTAEQRGRVKEEILERYRSRQHEVVTCEEICVFIEENWGIRYSVRGLYNLIHRMRLVEFISLTGRRGQSVDKAELREALLAMQREYQQHHLTYRDIIRFIRERWGASYTKKKVLALLENLGLLHLTADDQPQKRAKLTPAQEEELKQEILLWQSQRQKGKVQYKEIQAYIRKRWGIDYSRSGMFFLLRRLRVI